MASPELRVLAPVFKRHETDAPPDIGEHMGDLEVEGDSLCHSPSQQAELTQTAVVLLCLLPVFF